MTDGRHAFGRLVGRDLGPIRDPLDGWSATPRRPDVTPWWSPIGGRSDKDQYSPLMTKYEPRIVLASLDFCRANLNAPSSAGISIPSESLNPTARFMGPSS